MAQFNEPLPKAQHPQSSMRGGGGSLRAAVLAVSTALSSAHGPSASRYPIPHDLPPHPRLLLDDSGAAALRRTVASDAAAREQLARVVELGRSALSAPLPTMPDCRGAVGLCRGPFASGNVSRPGSMINPFVNYAVELALLHRLGADGTDPSAPSKWSVGAVRAMRHWANYSTWYWPVGQALELAMASHRMAVAFDWLYSVLTEEERQMAVDALVGRGLRQAERNFREGLWWTRDIYNWNLVSNGGMVPAALAVADHNDSVRALAQTVLDGALGNMQPALPSWAPDGVWPEGSGYWAFALQYTVVASASLTSAIGHDFGVSATPGLSAAGLYGVVLAGPSFNSFNWADSHASLNDPHPLMWMARTFNKTAYAAAARWQLEQGAASGTSSAMALVFWDSRGARTDIESSFPRTVGFRDPSTDAAKGRKTHVGFFRQCWLCANASWSGFKGGQNHFDDHGSDSHNNHGHLDLGHFVFEMAGQRWAASLGSGQYDYPDLSYFGRFRFSYYHTSSFGHNVLLFDGLSQHRFGNASIERVEDRGDAGAEATVDLTSGYGGATSVKRTFAFGPGFKSFTVSDAWVHDAAEAAEWRMHTCARVRVDEAAAGRTAVLELGGQTLLASVRSRGGPSAARFQTHHLADVVQAPQVSRYTGGDQPDGGCDVHVLTVAVPASDGGLEVTFEAQG